MKQPRKLAAEELFEYAVRALGARAHSTGDLRTKLNRRALHRPDVDAAIERLREIGYLDDTRFAESFAAARASNDHFGRTRILMDLRARRIAGELATQAVDQALAGTTEAEQIQAYIERKMPSLKAAGPIEDQKKLASAWRRLQRAGFRSGPALAALKGLSARPELTDDFPEEDLQDEAGFSEPRT